MTRKDIASYAGVTPALVTYYFPDRNGLVEAATLPVVQALVDAVANCFDELGPARQQLSQAIVLMLEAFTHDGPILRLFNQHRSSTAETAMPDLLGKLDACLVAFFEGWLTENEKTTYDAVFLQKASIGICRSIGNHHAAMARDVACETSEQTRRASMICAMLVGPDVVGTAREAVLCGFGP